ncbi:hypothetical protein BHM03_00039473 [Ensete ventricosum]|nr:hypothetical protein BHM03_00039473 [Ensete ventricosum]
MLDISGPCGPRSLLRSFPPPHPPTPTYAGRVARIMIATWPNRIRCSARSDERGCGRLRSAAVTRARRGPDVTAVSRLMWLAVGTATARVSTRETWAFGELSEGGSGSRGPTGTRHPTRRQTSDVTDEPLTKGRKRPFKPLNI